MAPKKAPASEKVWKEWEQDVRCPSGQDLGLMNCNIQLTVGSDQVGTGVGGKATKVLLETRQSNCSTNKCAVVELGVCGTSAQARILLWKMGAQLTCRNRS